MPLRYKQWSEWRGQVPCIRQIEIYACILFNKSIKHFSQGKLIGTIGYFHMIMVADKLRLKVIKPVKGTFNLQHVRSRPTHTCNGRPIYYKAIWIIWSNQYRWTWIWQTQWDQENWSYTYDEYLICITLGPSISSVICKDPPYSGPSYPSSPVYYHKTIY